MRDLRLDDRVQLNVGGHGSACGKAILIGEHFVVHGAPALALPIHGRGVELTTRASDHFAVETLGQVDARATTALRGMVERLGLDVDTIAITIAATLPLAGGLGGSAAVAVALVRALGVTDPDEVRRLAHDLEHIAHGRPSGIDDAVVSYEAPMRFQRTPDGIRMDRLAVTMPDLWVATVPRTRPTKDAVAGVGAWAAAHPAAFGTMLATIAGWVDRIADTADPATIGAAMNDAHQLLDVVGVVDPRHTALVAAARGAGALGAKMTGAGFGGAMLALAPGIDLAPVLRAAGAEDVFFTGELG